MTLVEIQISAIKRHHYTTHIELPDHLSEPDLATFVDQALQEVDESEFLEVGFGLEIEDSTWTVCRDLPVCPTPNTD